MSRPALEEAILKVRQELVARTLSEAEVSQGPVRRLLDALGWDVFDPNVLKPEYSVGTGRVDYALKSAPAKVDVFLEIKAPGRADLHADQQLFQYTVHQGVPLACLTDGRVWSFYLPGGQGSYEERRLFRLDLLEREIAESSARLDRYLGRNNVASGRFRDYARSDYEDKERRSRLHALLPEVWGALLTEPDELLCDLLSEAIEREAGERPSTTDVVSFLQQQATAPQLPTKPVNGHPSPGRPGTGPEPTRTKDTVSSRAIGFQYEHEMWQMFQTGKACYVALIRLLSQRHPTFCELFARAGSGRKRAWVAIDRESLFPGRPEFQTDEVTDLGNGWFVGTQTNPEEFEKRARVACACVGLELGRNVKAVFSRKAA